MHPAGRMSFRRFRGKLALELCLACTALVLAVALVTSVPALQEAREMARRAKCSTGLKQVSIVRSGPMRAKLNDAPAHQSVDQ